MVRILLYLVLIRRLTDLISVFSLNTGKYGPAKTPYLDTFHAVMLVLRICELHCNIIVRDLSVQPVPLAVNNQSSSLQLW